MNENSNTSPELNAESLEPTPEQVLYAGVLAKGMYAGLLCLFVTFGLYVSGVMSPKIPKEDLAQYWGMPV